MGQAPTTTAIVGGGSNMLVVGLGLSCWRAWSQGRPVAFLGSLVPVGWLPFVTVARQGYLSNGIGALLAVLSFVKTFRMWPRWSFLAAGFLFGYVGLSFFGGYMRDRSEIREAVWGGDSLAERLDKLYLTVSDFLLPGGTLWQAVTALVPRAIWPSKPVVAGSGDLVSRYTGLSFDEDTSVGVGQVMEFYINFGTIGVVLGFLGLGGFIAVVDSMARRRLVAGDWQGFALWYMPGLCLLQAGGSLVDMVGSGGAAVINVLLVNHVLLRLAGVGEANTGGLRRSGRFAPP